VSARGFRAWAPIVLWAAVIFAFSAVPSLSSGLGTWDLLVRKIAHLSEYAILGALLVRAIQRPAVAILAGGLYAVSDELHQHFVRGRHAVWYDVLIDTVGVAIGVLAWSRVRASRVRARRGRAAQDASL
jgi:VanZ family protein